MSEPVRVALYTRISTDETNQPYSLGAQSDRLEAYVASQPGWTIVERYTDQARAKNLDGLPSGRSERQLPRVGSISCSSIGSIV